MSEKSAIAYAHFANAVLANPDAHTPLKVARYRHGLTGAQLASAAGINRATLSDAENGQAVSDVTKQKIARVLGRTVTDLFPAETSNPSAAYLRLTGTTS